MTWGDLTGALRRFWLLAAAVFLGVMGIGLAAALIPQKRYRATATLVVQPASVRAFDFGAAAALEFLMPVFVRQVTTQRFEAAVRADLAQTLRNRQIELQAASQPGSGLLSVSATDGQPAVAAAVANASARQLIVRRPSRIVRISLLDPARPPSDPASPQRIPILFGSAVLGLIAAIFIALTVTAYRRRLSDAEAVRKHARVDVLGEIPALRRPPTTSAQAFADAPHIRDAYRRLAARLQVAVRAELLREQVVTIAVTSWGVEEGKTTVTGNLAWALALGGQPTMAIDADVRGPALHRAFDLAGTRGIADIARGGSTEAGISPTTLPSLMVVQGGAATAHPVDVVAAALPRIFNEISEGLVLVDSPSVMNPETTTIATEVQAVIVVVDGRRTKPEHLERTLRELELVGTPVLGVVINRARGRRARHSISASSDEVYRSEEIPHAFTPSDAGR
jgi:succinoglycan biosynthesis transport protein ExoP